MVLQSAHTDLGFSCDVFRCSAYLRCIRVTAGHGGTTARADTTSHQLSHYSAGAAPSGTEGTAPGQGPGGPEGSKGPEGGRSGELQGRNSTEKHPQCVKAPSVKNAAPRPQSHRHSADGTQPVGTNLTKLSWLMLDLNYSCYRYRAGCWVVAMVTIGNEWSVCGWQ